MSEDGELKILGLFEGYGIELEYMIVDLQTLSVKPAAFDILKSLGGDEEGEAVCGEVAWSNELAMHVIELKTNGPVSSLSGLGQILQSHVARLNGQLRESGTRLMPTAMHPWMDPSRELVLWPHENDVVYRAFDRIFDCTGHGWANLQSMHINLPFSNDDEFGRLHAAIRVILPILPALAASSPFIEGRASELSDTRLAQYKTNARRVPSVSGMVIPEPVFTRDDYERVILGQIYEDMRELDPDGVLRHEWVNARGSIARFDRNALEIRVLDTQECPRADIAIAGAVTTMVRALVEQRWSSFAEQKLADTAALASILDDSIGDAGQAVIRDESYLALFGQTGPLRVSELWQRLLDLTLGSNAGDSRDSEWRDALTLILEQGCLSHRIRRACGGNPTRAKLAEVYGRLCDCLERGVLFEA